MTTMSPVAASKPTARALPLPLRVCCRNFAAGRTRATTSAVSSEECPSTTITSCTAGSFGSTSSRFRASLRAGTMIETFGVVTSRC
jgi:hypothetical protein